MTTEVPNVSPTGRYNTKETAAALGVCVDRVRNYANRGVLKCGYRRHNGRRFYEGSEIIRFWRSRL